MSNFPNDLAPNLEPGLEQVSEPVTEVRCTFDYPDNTACQWENGPDHDAAAGDHPFQEREPATPTSDNCEECGGFPNGKCYDHLCTRHQCNEHCPFWINPFQPQEETP